MQLWKDLYEAGVDLIVTPYRGRPVASPGGARRRTRVYEGESFARARDAWARLKGDRYLRRGEARARGDADKLVREVVWRWVTPRWQRHVEAVLEREGDVDAVIVFTVPMAHLRGIPAALRERFDVPVVFYDGDVPMSLPEFGGMDTGFNYYYGADPGEYDLVVSNSEGGLGRLRELGARRAESLLLGRRPRALRAAGRREGARRLLLRLRRQVPRESMGFVGEPSRRAARRRLRARRRRLPGASDSAARSAMIPFNVVHARDLGGADQAQRHVPRARDRARIVDRAGLSSSRWRAPRSSRIPSRGSSLVRARPRAARRRGRRRGDGGVQGAARGSGRARGARHARTGAGARRAHVRASRAQAARADRPARAGDGRLTELLEATAGADARLRALKRVAIVPAFNEEEAVTRVIEELRAFDPGLDVVVVDDGSTDRTAEAPRACGANVVRLPFNLGIGGAVQTGFRYAWEHGFDVAVRVDGDGQHDPGELGVVLAPVLADEADIAVGSRFIGGEGYRSSRRAASASACSPGSSPRSRASASPTRPRGSRPRTVSGSGSSPRTTRTTIPRPRRP